MRKKFWSEVLHLLLPSFRGNLTLLHLSFHHDRPRSMSTLSFQRSDSTVEDTKALSSNSKALLSRSSFQSRFTNSSWHRSNNFIPSSLREEALIEQICFRIMTGRQEVREPDSDLDAGRTIRHDTTQFFHYPLFAGALMTGDGSVYDLRTQCGFVQGCCNVYLQRWILPRSDHRHSYVVPFCLGFTVYSVSIFL